MMEKHLIESLKFYPVTACNIDVQMLSSEIIKKKIQNIDPNYWWGDDFDVRFYLLSRVKGITNKTILDIGGGIGIISSELDASNFRINLDLVVNDLKVSKKNFREIENICASITHLPFIDESIDCVICANILEVAKKNDMEVVKTSSCDECFIYPSIEKTIIEIRKSLKKNGKLFLTTPNNRRYRSSKLTYTEVKYIERYFSKFSLFFFNTYPRLSTRSPKLNLANVIPKLLSKFYNFEKILRMLLEKDVGYEKDSVAFYVEAEKKEL